MTRSGNPDPPDPFVDTITSVHQAVRLGIDMPRSWFRGHKRIHGELTPGVFRPKMVNIARSRAHGFAYYLNPQKMSSDLPLDTEAAMILEFRRNAPMAEHELPRNDSPVEWLFWMQHFGLPTRLLDWSQSVLTALFFAVEEDGDDEDGELWVMYPDALGMASSVPGIPLVNDPYVRYLAEEPVQRDRLELSKRLSLSSIPDRPIPLLPPVTFPRMQVQQSAFTLHPVPQPGRTIPDLLRYPKHLCRYRVNGKAKDTVREELGKLGINHWSLFQDLSHLSKTIQWEQRVIAYSPPDPPRFGSDAEPISGVVCLKVEGTFSKRLLRRALRDVPGLFGAVVLVDRVVSWAREGSRFDEEIAFNDFKELAQDCGASFVVQVRDELFVEPCVYLVGPGQFVQLIRQTAPSEEGNSRVESSIPVLHRGIWIATTSSSKKANPKEWLGIIVGRRQADQPFLVCIFGCGDDSTSFDQFAELQQRNVILAICCGERQDICGGGRKSVVRKRKTNTWVASRVPLPRDV